MQFSKLVILLSTAALMAICAIAAPLGFCEDIIGGSALQNEQASEMHPDLAGIIALEPEWNGGLIPSSASVHSYTHSYKTAESSSATPTGLPNAKHHINATPSSPGPIALSTVFASPTDQPFAGFVPSQCDWSTGTFEHGEGKMDCVALCRDKFGDQEECDGSRCIAIDGFKNPGKCFCTCTCPN